MQLKVHDMSCGHCAQTIAKAVKSVDPAAEVQSDVALKTVAIRSSADEARIIEAVRAAGYDSELLNGEARQ